MLTSQICFKKWPPGDVGVTTCYPCPYTHGYTMLSNIYSHKHSPTLCQSYRPAHCLRRQKAEAQGAFRTDYGHVDTLFSVSKLEMSTFQIILNSWLQMQRHRVDTRGLRLNRGRLWLFCWFIFDLPCESLYGQHCQLCKLTGKTRFSLSWFPVFSPSRDKLPTDTKRLMLLTLCHVICVT